MRFLVISLLGIVMLLLQGCNSLWHQSQSVSPARLGEETTFHSELKSLPPPREKLIAAVYKFRDQTGQYKLTETGSSWSTAVTQGATTILIRTLEESGWFRPLERENLANLSTERQIITNTLAAYEGKRATALSPLLFAGILLEGGIISYESNVRTGGLGMRYFGAGGSGQYREDKITIYLRAVSTKNGEILKTVYSTKTILSQQIEFGVFRYVKYKRLLEAETGITYNEPTEIAITEAIEKSVYSLIVEGLMEGFWDIDGSSDTKMELISAYQQEKEENEQVDHIGRKKFDTGGMLGLGLIMAAAYVDNDVRKNTQAYSVGFNSFIKVNKIMSLNFEGLYGKFSAGVFGNKDYLMATPYLKFDILPNERFTPDVSIGYGVLNNQITGSATSLRDFFGHVYSSVGFTYSFSSRIQSGFSIANRYFTTDDLDRRTRGTYNDMMWEARFRLNYVFGKNWKNRNLAGNNN